MATLSLLCILSLLSFLPLLQSTAEQDSSSIISRFQDYLRINTAQPSPNYFEAADFIVSQAESLSLQSQTLELVPGKPLILLKWPGQNPDFPSILLNSHTDVVPVEANKWAHPPFAANIDADGKIFARGSQFRRRCLKLYLTEIEYYSGLQRTLTSRLFERQRATSSNANEPPRLSIACTVRSFTGY